mgnify:CR=1 FL=1
MLREKYTYIKTRRNGSKIYQAGDGSHFAKAWLHEAVSQEADLYQKLGKYGIKLPTVISVQTIMMEQSFWEKTFADLFTESYSQVNIIQEEIFDNFIVMNQSHLDSQIKLIGENITDKKFASFDHLAEENRIDPDLIKKAYEKIMNVVQSMPMTRNHWDYNPYNIFPEWVIDLEDWFLWPIGYDTITSLTQNYRFPDEGDYELHRQHSFSLPQIVSFLTRLSDNAIKINFLDKDLFAALFLMRWAFVTAWSSRAPKSQAYRYELFQTLLEKFLAWEDLLHFFLSTYHKLSKNIDSLVSQQLMDWKNKVISTGE